MKRRTFLKLSAAAGAAAASAGCARTYELLPGMNPRGWDPHAETEQTSFCTLCPARCGLRVRVVDGHARAVAGLAEHPINRGGLCRLGASALQLRLHPHRLVSPYHLTDHKGVIEKTTWNAARTALVKALSESQGRALVVVSSLAGSTRIDLWRRLLGEIGGEVVLWAGDDMEASWAEVARWTMGVDSPPAADWDRSDLVVTVGLDALATGPSPVWAQHVLGSNHGAQRWLHVGPRLNATAARADLWLACRPGTEAWVLLAMAYVLLKRQAHDAVFLARHTRGFEDLAGQILEQLDPRRASRITGVPEDRLLEAGVMLSTSRRPVCVPGEEALWTANGHVAGWAALVLNALSGSIATPGGLVIRPPLPLNDLPGKSAAAQPLGLWLRRVASGDAVEPAVLILDLANPLFTFSDGSAVGRFFAKASQRFTFSLFADESAVRCHWQLPAAMHLEEWGDCAQPPGVPFDAYLLKAPAVQPRGEARAVGEVIVEAAADLGVELPAASYTEILGHRAAGLAGLNRGAMLGDLERLEQVAAMEERGWWFGNSEGFGIKKLAEGGGWADLNTGTPNWSQCVGTRDALVDLLPEALGNAHLAPPEEPPRLVATPHLEVARDPDLALTVPWTLRTAGLVEGQSWHCWAGINPVTARELGVTDGDLVRVRVPGGAGEELRVHAAVLPGLMPGVVSLPLGFGHRPGPSFFGGDDMRPVAHLIPLQLHGKLPTRIVGGVPVDLEVDRG